MQIVVAHTACRSARTHCMYLLCFLVSTASTCLWLHPVITMHPHALRCALTCSSMKLLMDRLCAPAWVVNNVMEPDCPVNRCWILQHHARLGGELNEVKQRHNVLQVVVEASCCSGQTAQGHMRQGSTGADHDISHWQHLWHLWCLSAGHEPTSSDCLVCAAAYNTP